MSIPTPEYLISRANKASLLPDGLQEDDVIKMLETLVAFHGKEYLDKCLLDLSNSLDGDYEVSESSLSYSGAFLDANELLCNEIVQKDFQNKIDDIDGTEIDVLYEGRTVNSRYAIPAGYTIQDCYTDATGTTAYLVADVEGNEPRWVAAPKGKPHLACQVYADSKEKLGDEDLLDRAKVFCEEGYTIPRDVVPTETTPGPEVARDHMQRLEGSRFLRKHYPRSSKAMVTPDGSKSGTLWKFDPIVQEVQDLFAIDKRCMERILICGSGATGVTGMCMAVLRRWPDAEVTVYDPKARKDEFPSHWVVKGVCYDKGVTDDMNYDFIFTDVAIGDGAQFCDPYVCEFAKFIVTRTQGKNAYVVFKETIRNLCRRSCRKIFFGRGHNMEMFVLRGPDNNKFLSQESALDIVEKKKRCDCARNYYHCFDLRARRLDPLIMLPPQPGRCGGTTAHWWAKHRKHTLGFSLAEHVRLLSGSDIDKLNPEDPIYMLVDLLRVISFSHPDARIQDVGTGGASRLIKTVREACGYDQSAHKHLRHRIARSDRNVKPDQRKAFKKERDDLARTYMIENVPPVPDAFRQAAPNPTEKRDMLQIIPRKEAVGGE